jgi:ABC-type transport system involved in multi-copper enzyme maturation permease subunit
MRRNHMVWFVCFVSVFLLFLMDAFHYFSIQEQMKMIQDFSLGLMNLCALFLVVYYPASLIKDEFKERTIYTLLSKPVSRSTFLFGKALAVLFLVAFALVCNTGALYTMLYLKGGHADPALLMAVFLIFLKNTLLIGFSILFGVMPLSTILCSILTFFVYCVGSVKTYFLGLHGEPSPYDTLIQILFAFFPNLYLFDLVEQITLGTLVPWSHLQNCLIHFTGISILVYGLALLIFELKEI